jgi:hypothetical protein
MLFIFASGRVGVIHGFVVAVKAWLQSLDAQGTDSQGRDPPHGLALALVNRRLASSTQNFPGLHPAVLVKRPTAPTQPPPPHPTGHHHHFSSTLRCPSFFSDIRPPEQQPPTMSSASPLEIATDLFNTIHFNKSLLSTSTFSFGTRNQTESRRNSLCRGCFVQI